jgi:uncharacterized 2Fe-2S/4Fe-4S cluster protein (DUF4445 family)
MDSRAITMKPNQPLVQLFAIEAEPPSLRDNTADLDRLKKYLRRHLPGCQLVTPYNRMARLAESFRQAGFMGTVVVNSLPYGVELVDFLPDRPALLPAMALDLGTTHLEARLVDLLSGRITARAFSANPQAAHGADILTRIHFTANRAAAKADGLSVLHRQVIDCINDLAADLAGQTGIAAADIRALAVAGNTTMVHFLLNLNPYHLCREPYIPLVNVPDPFPAEDLGIAIHPAAPLWIMPSVGSYFGGDLIAGIVATGLDQAENPSMLIDVGTNAEVVVGNRDWLIACAGAAGPALEGGVVEMGMRAGPGAVEHVEINPETGAMTYTTVDNGPAAGICGSGLIDLMAGLYLARIIDMRGKFTTGTPASPLREKLIRHGENRAFVVVPVENSANAKPVLLTQIDLDALMRSKAAMYSILTTLMNQVGLRFDELERIFVAGAFGRHIAPRQAITLGMLPDLPLSRYRPVGNSSLAGAEALLLDEEVRKRSLQVASKITYIELNVNQEFMIRFSGCRFIPHTDRALFPSVPFFSDI